MSSSAKSSSRLKRTCVRPASLAKPPPSKRRKTSKTVAPIDAAAKVPAAGAVLDDESVIIVEGPTMTTTTTTAAAAAPTARCANPALTPVQDEVQEVTAQEVREACIAKRTRVAYAGSLRAISRWIVDTKKLESPKYFYGDGQIDLERFNAADFEAFLLEKRKTVEVSSLNGFRSAIKNLYRRKEVALPVVYGKNMSTFFSGLKRMQATKNQSGAPPESGKDLLPYSLYQKLCCESLSRQDGGFVRLFQTTQWNLMCRSESVQTLCSEHLSAHDDSVGCITHKSKTNQEGSGPKDPRHMYAYPLSPATCRVTALAIYLACRPTQESGPLFPGSQQKSRFGTALRQLVGGQSGLNHYGTHSIRKGVATFACSGTTGGPSIASVRLRVGWSLGGVQDRYIRCESAGDQYLGRVVAGLPLNRAEFSILPSHFSGNNDKDVRNCIEAMFPDLTDKSSMQDILKLCIASLVYHEEYLREKLPASHPLLSTFLFRQDEVMNKMNSALASYPSPWMKPTGIPPHVELYKQLQTTQNSIDNLPPVLMQGISSLIEQKGVAAGNITKEVLETTIQRLLERAGMTAQQISAPQHNNQPSDTSHLHFYDGKFHLQPKPFAFPRMTPFGAWVLWWFGDKHQGFPPLKRIHTHDLPSQALHKSFSDLSVFVRHIAKAAASVGSPIPKAMSEKRAAEVFRTGMDNLQLAPSTRKHRLAELSVATIVRLVREAQATAKSQTTQQQTASKITVNFN